MGLRKLRKLTMYNDYEESFYYDKPSSISSGVSGEVVALDWVSVSV